MASSLLQQAVTLAQQGQRDEAARLLRQFVQSNPDHEVAWLWLASVASNQPEYVRALNEVLRVNPANARARRLLDDFNQQYGPLPTTAPRIEPMVTPAPSVTPTPITPPPMRAVREPYAQVPYDSEPPLPGSQVRYITEREVVVKRRGCIPGCIPGCSIGCGCWQACLLTLVVIVLLPMLACGALSFLPDTLGPLDWPASYLPGKLGRKTIEMTVDNHKVELTVPRSWQIAEDQNEWWELGREILTEAMPFDDSGTSWFDFEAPVGQATTILETDPASLARGGDVIGMVYAGTESGQFDCEDVRNNSSNYDDYVTYENDLCGWRTHSIDPWRGVKLTSVDPPDQVRTVEFRVPVSSSTALLWRIFLPENMYSSYRGDIDALIESAKVLPPADGS